MAKFVSSSYLASSYVAPNWFGDGTMLTVGAYVSPAYLAHVYVREGWFGEGSIIPIGKYIAAGYLRPGYVINEYLTNAGELPTSIFVEDSMDLVVGETKAYSTSLLRSDSLTLSLSESFNQTYKRHVVAFDTITVGLGEVKISRALNLVTDMLSLSTTEVVNNNQGTLTQILVEDDLDLELDDPGINQGIQALDTLNVTTTEDSDYTVHLLRADILSIALGELYTKFITGTTQKNVSDSLNLVTDELTGLHPFRQLGVTDTLDFLLDESSNISFGIILQYLQAFDNLTLETDDLASLPTQVDVVGKYGSDPLDIILTDVGERTSLRFVTVGDTLLLQVMDAAEAGKISIQQTWEEANYPWGGSTLRDIKALPVFLYDFDFYQADSADTFISPQGVQGIQVVLERLGLTIYGRDRQGNWKEDPDLIKLVKGLYPILRGEPGTVVNIYVGAQETMEGPVEWDGPHPFVIGTDTKIDPIISGPFVAVRFESAGQKPWKLLSYQLDITTVGRRN